MAKSSIATAYVQILPTTDDLKVNLSKDILPAAEDVGKEGGSRLGSSFVSSFVPALQTIASTIASATKTFISFTNETAKTGDVIDKQSQKIGVSAEQYQILAYAAEHSGFSIETFQTAAKQLESTEFSGTVWDALEAIEAIEDPTKRSTKAIELFGVRSAQEMAALLNGVDNINDYGEALASLNGIMSNEAVQASAAYEDAITDMNVAFKGLTNGLVSEFLPSMTTVVNGIAQLVSGNLEGLKKIEDGFNGFFETILNKTPEILTLGTRIVGNLADAILAGIPAIVESGKSIISELKNGFVANLPELISQALPMLLEFSAELRSDFGELVDLGIDLILSLVDGLVAGLPDLIKFVPQIVSNIAGLVNDNMPKILEAGVNIIIALISGLVSAIPDIVANMGNIMKAVMDVIQAINWLNLGKSIIEGIVKGLRSLATSLPETLKGFGESAVKTLKNIDWANLGQTIINFIVNGLKSLVMAIPNALKSIGQSAVEAMKNISWLDLGKNIISGIAAGISGAASSIVDAAKNAAKNAFEAAKNFLGIKSPSRLFREGVGKMISLGLAEGIEENTAPISAAMDEITAMTTGAFDPTWTLNATATGTTGSYSGGDTMGQLLTLVAGLSAKLDRMEVRLDGRTLVGGLVDTMDQALGDWGALTARGVA